MRVLARLLVVVEALVCFGPLLLLLGVGLLLTPFWVAGMAVAPEQTAEPTPAWDFLYPLMMVLLGVVGIIALACVVVEIASGKRLFSMSVRAGVMAPGVLAVLMFNWPWIPTLLAGELTFDALWPLSIYCILPLAGSAHLLWLASTNARTRTL